MIAASPIEERRMATAGILTGQHCTMTSQMIPIEISPMAVQSRVVRNPE